MQLRSSPLDQTIRPHPLAGFPKDVPELKRVSEDKLPALTDKPLLTKSMSGWFITTADVDISVPAFARDVALFQEHYPTLAEAYGVSVEELKKLCENPNVRRAIDEAKKQVEETGQTVCLARDILEGALPVLNQMIHDEGLEPKDRIAAFKEVKDISALQAAPKNAKGSGPQIQMVFKGIPDKYAPPGAVRMPHTEIKSSRTRLIEDPQEATRQFLEEDDFSETGEEQTFVREEDEVIPNFGDPDEFDDDDTDDLQPLDRPAYPKKDEQRQQTLDFMNRLNRE